MRVCVVLSVCEADPTTVTTLPGRDRERTSLRTLREEHSHSLSQYVVETCHDEHLLGRDLVVHENVRQDRAEQADSCCEHYE